MPLHAGNANRLLRQTLWPSSAAAALLCAVGGALPIAVAQDSAYDPANFAWQAGAMAHAQRMHAFHDADSDQQPTPR